MSGGAPMPESQRASAGAADGGSGGLLATKLFMPRPQRGFVSRPRLDEELGEGLSRGLILVCAPAGFGKTSLLADWIPRSPLPVAWLSLDAGDNDPVRFWRHAIAALDRVRRGLAERAAPLLGPPPPPSFEGLVEALINELAQPGEGDVLLVLDDYDRIAAQPVHASLAFLLEQRPPELHLVLMSRADPPLPLARLRARGQLAELRAAELRFTGEEAAALLRDAVGADLDDGAVAALATRTEGWAAGLQLAALSLRGRSDVAGFVATFSGSHRYVLDYLAEEVLAGQPEPVRRFLLETSVLDRLSGPLCDEVTGRTDGQEMLELVERANLFLVPLDEVRVWWRYHHLFADLLRARLQQEQPDRPGQLHAAAGRWHEEHGLIDDAVRHAVGAGDHARAARLIEEHFDAAFLPGESATIRRWFSTLPVEVVSSRPRLSLAQASLALAAGDAEAAEPHLDAAERSFADVGDEPYEPSVGRDASALANVPAGVAIGRAFIAALHGDPKGTAANASQALAQLGEDEQMLSSSARQALAVAEWLDGRLPEAEAALTSLVEEYAAAGESRLIAWAGRHLGEIQRAQGRLDASQETYERTLKFAAESGPSPAIAGVAYVGLAAVAYQRGDLDAALRDVSEGIRLCRLLAYTQPLVEGLTTLAWIRQAHGDADGASDASDEAEQASRETDVVGVLDPAGAQRARLLLVQGDVSAAAGWTSDRGLAATDETSYRHEPGYLLLARVLLAQGRPDEAVGLTRRLRAEAIAQVRTGSLIEIHALLALALAATGDEAGALETLSEALTLAHPQGYIRVFVDEGPPMSALLGRLIGAQRTEASARAVPLDYLGRLTRAFAREGAPDAPAPRRRGAVVPGMVEALSERELEVLQLLAAGKRNREIASELYVAIDTVKKHVTHIFEKLGAANRTEATARARELGLLAGATEPPASFQS
jgi:ATP/maltotriose-dependent transcriptional regulator MalT